MCLRHVFSVGHDTSRIDSLGNFDRVGQCARRPEPWLFDLATYGFDHGTEDERKIYGSGKDSTTHKNGVPTGSEAHRPFTK